MIAAILTISGTNLLTSCGKEDNNPIVQPTTQPTTKEYFTLWNQCEALMTLKDYVKDVTNPSSPNFIKEEDRIATFDMDGTFVGELYPTYFEYNMLEYRCRSQCQALKWAPCVGSYSVVDQTLDGPASLLFIC